jgi:tRNA G18 (ribose-2'-O)-methylase SpoU
MPCIEIADFRDPRVDVYRDLPTAHLTRYSGLFIAEGEKLVRRVAESDYVVRSVLAERSFAELAKSIIGDRAPIFVLDREPLLELVSFKFHRGLMACGERKTPVSSAAWLGVLPAEATLIACDTVCDPENLGGILRNAAAFGVDGVLIGRGCADPFSRRVLRVSMGTAFKLRLAQCEDLAAELKRVHVSGFETIGAILAPEAIELEKASRQTRSVLVLGNEGHGLTAEVAAACSKKVKLEMRRGVDSLNVSVASGVFLYHFMRQAGRHAT